MRTAPIFAMILLALALVAGTYHESRSQGVLLQKKDSLVCGVDTISQITPSGTYVSGAFTIYNSTGAATITPQARYYGSSDWVTTSVKNTRTQTSDTTIASTASSWPVDYVINDPCIVGFRLVKTDAFASGEKVYVYFRFRR